MTSVIKFMESLWGFHWGSVTIERLFSSEKKGWVTLGISTPKAQLQVYVTKTGKVRIHDQSGNEWLPKGVE